MDRNSFTQPAGLYKGLARRLRWSSPPRGRRGRLERREEGPPDPWRAEMKF